MTKNVGVPDTPLRSADSTSWPDTSGVHVLVELLAEARDVEPELLGVAEQVLLHQVVLPGQQQVVHLPEPPLLPGRLGRLGRELGLGMHVGQRQVPPHEADVLLPEDGADGGLGLAAVRALEVAVLDDGDGGVSRSADVVALGVDVVREVDELLGAAEERLGTPVGRQQCGDPEDHPGRPRRRRPAAARTPIFASARASPSKARVAIRNETVNPIPAIVPLPATDAHPTAGCTRPCVSRAIAQDADTTATGLPTTYPRTMPSVIGEVTARRRKSPSITMPALASANSGTIT